MLRLLTENEKVVPVSLDDSDSNTEKSISTDVSDTEKISDVEAEAEGNNDTVEDEAENVTADYDTIKKACQDSVNSLVQNAWDFISNVNSVIATIDYDYKESNKESLLEILNNIVDDATVIVGMLYSGINLIDAKTTELIQSGSEKAENLIDNM